MHNFFSSRSRHTISDRDWSSDVCSAYLASVFFFQAEDGIRDLIVTGVQTCALPILSLEYVTRAATVVTPASGRLPMPNATLLNAGSASGAEPSMTEPSQVFPCTKLFEIGRASCRERV